MNKKDSFTIPADVTAIESALDPISDLLRELGTEHKVAYKVRLALDEILVNVASYAYDGREGEIEIRYEVNEDPRTINITIVDSGKPFNPLEVDEPEFSSDVNERKIGGLGIYIVRKMMDEINYHRENNQNILIIKKSI